MGLTKRIQKLEEKRKIAVKEKLVNDIVKKLDNIEKKLEPK